MGLIGNFTPQLKRSTLSPDQSGLESLQRAGISIEPMEKKRDLTIVLRSVRFEERHRIVTGLTETQGRVSGMARNSISSRRFGGTLEPGVASLWHFVEKPGAELVRIEETEIRREFAGIRKSLERLSASAWLCELVLLIAPEREPVPELFRLLANALAWLDESPETEIREKYGLFLNLAAGKMLQLSGTQPRIAACESCELPIENSNPETRFRGIPERASILCTHCRPDGTDILSAQSLIDLLGGLSLPIRKALENPSAPGRQHRALFHFIENLLVHHAPGFDPSKVRSREMLLAAMDESIR